MESLIEKAKALLQQCEVVTLTSINKEGYPRPVPMSKIKKVLPAGKHHENTV